MQKNGQISSIHGKPEEQADINGTSEQLNTHQEEISPIEVEQDKAVSQKVQDKMEIDQEVAVQTNGEEEQKNAQEGKAQTGTDTGEQQEVSEGAQAGEIGFKKVFKFVGFKFTVKKEKSVKSEPVQLLTVKKDEEVTAAEGGDESKSKGEVTVDHEVASAPEESSSETSPPEAPSLEKVDQVIEQAATEAEPGQTATEPVETVPAITEAVEPATEAVEPATEAVEPATEAVEPATEAVEPATEAVEPATEAVEPAATEAETLQTTTEATAAEEPLKPAESPVSPVESNAAASPFKRFFKQGFFSGLRKKPSFKKTPEEMLVTEKTEMIAVKGSEGQEDKLNGSGKEGNEEIDQEAKPQPSTPEQVQDMAGLQTEITAEEKSEKVADIGDFVPALNDDDTMIKGITTDVSAEPGKVCTPVQSEVNQIKPASAPVQQAEALPQLDTTVIEAPAESQPEKAAVSQEKFTTEDIVNEAELLSSQEKAKLQGSPLKKLFTNSGIKKLSSKKSKGRKEETKVEEPDDAKMQMHSSTESEESPDGPKSESPVTSPEEMPKPGISEVMPLDTTHVNGHGENGSADSERRKEGVTAWASFKRLVTPKRHPKRPSDSDKEDDQTEKAKTSTISSTESAASATSAVSVEKPPSPIEKQEESVPNAEEQKLERSNEDPRKKVDASVSWEALICVGSSKKRARKPSDPESVKPSEEMEKSMEESEAVQDHVDEEVKTSSTQDTNQEPVGTSPERLESPVEEATEGTVSTWESFKRLVTPRRKSKSKLEERIEEPTVNVDAVPPESEPVKEESWATFKKLIPGRRKRKSDAKPEHVQAEKLTEVGENKSDEESETPAVVPLSEYIIIEQEAKPVELEKVLDEEKQPEGAETSQMTLTGEIPDERSSVVPLSKDVEPGAETIPTVERTPLETAKICVDERSPSWISAKVCEKDIKNETEDVAEQRRAETEPTIQQVVVSAIKSSTEIVHEVSQDDAVPPEAEPVKEVQEVFSEVVTAPEYPVEESFTEETEMVSAVSQLTETSATTAEGTPLQEDVQSTKQTEDVLQEVAEKVKLSEDGIGPLTKMVIANGASLEESKREIGGFVEKDQLEMVKESYDMSECIKEEAEKTPAVAEESEPTDLSEESEDLQDHGITGKTAVKTSEVQEVVATSILQEAETVPHKEVDALQGDVPAEVIQKKGAEMVLVEKPIASPKVAEEAMEIMQMGKATIEVQEISTARVAQKLDTGVSEAPVGDLAKVGEEIVCEEILRSTSTNVDVEMKKAETLSEETLEATMVEKVEVENVEAVCETTEIVASEVVRQMGAEENGAVDEQSFEATPAKIIEKVTAADIKAVTEEIKPISSLKVGGEKTEAALSLEGVECVDKELAADQVAESIVEQAVKLSADTKLVDKVIEHNAAPAAIEKTEEPHVVEKVVLSEVPEVEKLEKTKDVEHRLEQTKSIDKVKQIEEPEKMVVQMQVGEKVEQFEAPDKAKSVQMVEIEQFETTEKEVEQIKIEVTKALEVTEKVEVIDALEVTENLEQIKASEEEVELVKAPEIIEKAEPIEAPEVTEKVDQMEASKVTEKVEPIEAPEVTEKVDQMEASKVTEKVEPIEAPEVTEKVDQMEASKVTEKVDQIEASKITEKVEPIEAPEVTEKVDQMEASKVTEKVEPIEAPEVTEKVDQMEASKITEKVEPIEAPEVTEKVDQMEASKVTEKVEPIEAPEVTEKEDQMEASKVTEKVEQTEATEKEAVQINIELIEAPEVTEKVEMIEASKVAEKVEQTEATEKEAVQINRELTEAPEVTGKVEMIEASKVTEKVDQMEISKVTEKMIEAPEVTEKIELTKATEKEIKVEVTEASEVTEKVEQFEAPEVPSPEVTEKVEQIDATEKEAVQINVELKEVPVVPEKVEQTKKEAEQIKVELVKAPEVTEKVEKTEVLEVTEQMVEKVEQTDIIEVADKLEGGTVALSGEVIEVTSLEAEQVEGKNGVSCEEKVETTRANLVEQVAAETNGVACDRTIETTSAEVAEQVDVHLQSEPVHEVAKPEPGKGTEMIQEKLEAVALQRVESEMVEATRTDLVQEVAEKIQTEMTEAVSEEMIEVLQESLGSTDREKQSIEAQVVTPTIPTVETRQEEPIAELECRELVRTIPAEDVEEVGTEMPEAACEDRNKLDAQPEQIEETQLEEEVGLNMVTPAESAVTMVQNQEAEVAIEEKIDSAVAVLGEVELRASWEELAVETEMVKPIDQLEAKPEMEEDKIAHQSESPEQGAAVEEVIYELIDAAQTKPDEAELVKEAVHKDEVQPECIKAETPDGEQKEDAVKVPEITAAAGFELLSAEAQVEGFKEAELLLASEPKQVADLDAKVCSASIEVQAAENEAAIPITAVPVTESLESREVAFPVTVAAIEEQVLTETTAVIEAPVEAEVSEVIDQSQELDERFESTVKVSVVETAAAIVEAAIEAATGCFSDDVNVVHETDLTPDVQQSIMDESPEGTTEHTDVAESKIESAMETDGQSSLTGTVEVQGTVAGFVEQQVSMMVQNAVQSIVLTENTVETVAPVSSDAEWVGKPTLEGETPEVERAVEAEIKCEQKIADQEQILERLETEAMEQVSIKEMLMPNIEIVLEAIKSEQEQVEIKVLESTEAKCESLLQTTLKDLQPDENSEDETTTPTQSEVTKVEPCQLLQTSEEMQVCAVLTEIPKEPNMITQQQAETATSVDAMPAEILVAAKGGPTQELAIKAVIETNEDEQWEVLQEEVAQEPGNEETLKQESQEAGVEHQVSLSSTLQCVQITTQQTPS
uniref:A kinase-anchoring proteins AKAP-5 and AKAP-12 calmodulin (CaM)-binding domain-containing protein n=1 Tax=Callorhinchus milii TaxID=7868 RepID=A0A4W3HEU5_CALMI